MTNWAIVAIPEEGDRVWKVSSEKVPHLTLLSLGEQTMGPAAAQMEEFLAHVAETSMRRFGLEVDRRGELGPDKADVLFFQKDQATKRLGQIRSYLLTNAAISKAYNSSEQFPEWTPHLTLGYPAAPAREDGKDYPIGWVFFDRVALWVSDFDGPTFVLPGFQDFGNSEMAMDDMDTDEFLAHHGVKGMRWGVRRSVGSDGLVVGSSRPTLSHPSGGGHASADHEKAVKALAKANQKGHNSLSNEELKAITNRIKTQKEFTQLTNEQHSELKQKVEQLRLEKDYRQLKSEAALANRSTGRKIIDSLIQSAQKAAMEKASSAGEKMIKDLLAQTGSGPKDVGFGGKKKSSTKSPFVVNPDKVKFTPTKRPGSTSHNLPDLLKRR